MVNDIIGKWMNSNCEKCKLYNHWGECKPADDILLGYFGDIIPEKTINFIGGGFTMPCPHKQDKEMV